MLPICQRTISIVFVIGELMPLYVRSATAKRNCCTSCSFTLGDRIVNSLEYPNFLRFDSQAVPQLKSFVKLSYGAVIKGACMAAILYRNNTCSTTYFDLVKD